ncbi:hypothetical protein V4F39_05725 [Aquincola sp. MAHUQ-54]|uniref:DUF2782 domain-containing protein n=1 Tax=Aquincola agrisoli TaxID=3119538 RepID=A0AAW9QFJ6_9BURK
MTTTRFLLPLAALSACAALHGPAAAEPIEPKVQQTVIEDDGVRIEELRVRGQTQRLVVRPKGGGKAGEYEIIPADGARNMSQAAGASRGAAGQRVWNVLTF